MNREAKRGILKALGKGIISKVEARLLLKTDGIIIWDLSSEAVRPNPIEPLLAKVPNLKDHFIKTIYLGNGKAPN